jgi:serine/threonine protein kinase
VPELTPPDGPRELPPTGEHTTGSLGRYKILGELGRGGCGIVYRALDPSIGRMVAIKTILARTESSLGKESRERFRREARSAGNLSHPNIVTIHDFSDTGDPMFIAMEFIEGRTLAEAMSSGPLSLDFILGVLRSAADALDYAHSHHIVHRDIKPANFLISEDGRLKITDFGIAKMLDSDESLTSTGTVVGTVQYMSPEQISETQVTGLSDQFSLAVIAYEMLAGVKPFQGNSWATVIHAIIMADPPPIAKYRESLGERVNGVLRKALSKDPLARFATCKEFCDALEKAIASAPLEGTVIFAKPPEGRPSGIPAEREKSRVVDKPAVGNAPGDGATSKIEVLPLLAKAPPTAAGQWRSILIGAVGAVVIVTGGWLVLHSRNTHQATQPVTEQAGSPTQHSAPPAPALQPASPPEPKVIPVVPAPEAKAKQTTKQVKEQARQQTKIEPAVKPLSPVANANTQARPIIESAPPPTSPQPTTTALRDPTPAPPTAPAPKQIPDDRAIRADEQAKRLADEQTRRAADEQTKRLADEQTKRAADEQNKRLADEQAKTARAAEYASISRALRAYQTAYEQRDLTALQAIWPSIPKQALEGIRGSFRDATTISMDLRPLGDPKVSGNTATVLCDRNLHQVILKRALQASGRVRIVLSRAGSGWMIQSVDVVTQ